MAFTGDVRGIYILTVTCLLILQLSVQVHSRNWKDRTHGLHAPALLRKVDLPPDQWFDQKLNHFDDADARTWKQRYFVNDTFYKPGGPVFLMIGGEGTASPVWMVTGHWMTLAQKYGALCFQLEHRFYGKSHPTSDMSTANLRYLSSEQALADLANFRISMTNQMKLGAAKWISFGGSYPGSLSAWVREKYPHLIHASVATSAPILAVLDFKEYFGVVRDSLATTGPNCDPAIQKATEAVIDMMNTETGRAKLKTMFRLCDDIDVKNKRDVQNLYSSLAGNFAGVVQYNKDNRDFEGGRGGNITIDTLCGIMTNESQGPPINRYAAVNSMMLDSQEQKCLDFSYQQYIKEMQQTDWASSAAAGGRQWTYQTCTEFGFYQSSDLANHPFGHMFPVSFSIQQCTDIFGSNFTQESNMRGIVWTNTNYGGYAMKVTRVVFPNGSIDPWHALGITKDLGPEAPAVFIKGTAHCANMYPAKDDDPPQLTQARKTIDMWLGKWLAEED